MTNNHVVAGALRIRVIIAPATVEMVSGNTNLAIGSGCMKRS